MSSPELLLGALGSDHGCYILGSGASMPHVPTLARLGASLGAYSSFVRSFGAAPLPDSPLRRLLGELLADSATATTFAEFMPAVMTPATIAIALEDLVARAQATYLPQYAVFALLPRDNAVVSFNWDRLATRCPQRVVIHPHGTISARPRDLVQIADAIDEAQLYSEADAREWLIPDLVFPGEEEAAESADVRERVFRIWRTASHFVVVGYSFGLLSGLTYDRVWLDSFVEAARVNASASIHIVDPRATELAEAIADRVERKANVFAWPVSWYHLSRLLLRRASSTGADGIGRLLGDAESLNSLAKLCRGLVV